jgi:uncharacterized OB-fold protein
VDAEGANLDPRSTPTHNRNQPCAAEATHPAAARERETMSSTIPGLERPAPVPNELTKPFWDACNEQRLVLQNCTACNRLHYPPTQKCSQCGSADKLEWKAVAGKGHIDVYFVIRDSRIRGFRSAQPINFALITLDEDPGINFLSNLPGTPPGEVPVGAPVEVMFEQTSTGQLLPEWRVVS